MFIKAVAATLALLVASTSFADAGGVTIIELPKPTKSGVVIDPSNPKPIDIPGGPSGPKKPVVVIDPSNPKPIDIPGGPSGPKKPVVVIDPSNPKPIDIPVPGGQDSGKPGTGATNSISIACTIADPLGTTDHFWIVNSGEVPLPPGLKVRYRVPATGDHGAFLLPRQVAVGAKLLIPNLLHGAPSGAPCTAQIIA